MNAFAPASQVTWSDLDRKVVVTVRVLAADAHLLYQTRMRLDPADPTWLGRDRFVLSAGHSSLTQHIQLFLAGYGLELEDLKTLSTWGSKTPRHPESRHEPVRTLDLRDRLRR